VSLAKTYHVPLWDVYMIHLEFLFDENESQYVYLRFSNNNIGMYRIFCFI